MSETATTFEVGARVMVDPNHDDPFFINAGQPGVVTFGPDEDGDYLIVQDPPAIAGHRLPDANVPVAGWYVSGSHLTLETEED